TRRSRTSAVAASPRAAETWVSSASGQRSANDPRPTTSGQLTGGSGGSGRSWRCPAFEPGEIGTLLLSSMPVTLGSAARHDIGLRSSVVSLWSDIAHRLDATVL